MPIRLLLALIPLALAFSVMPARADHKDNGASAEEILVRTVFDLAEKAIIEEYFGKSKHEGKHKDHDDDDEDEDGHHHKNRDKHHKHGHHEKEHHEHEHEHDHHSHALPPGLQKYLNENGRLPHGLERDLPDDLKKRLPKEREGTKRVIVDNDVVLLEEGTRKILDVIEDVLSTGN
ncbi:MAG: hypothetical protein OEY94_03250 [Alphaproteobacteria bacterium]|nr:hypothetical protein [Alphaproteobacteria bacterium]